MIVLFYRALALCAQGGSYDVLRPQSISPLKKPIVSAVSVLAISKLMDLAERASHLKFSEMPIPESVGVVNAPPKETSLIEPFGLQPSGMAVIKSPESESMDMVGSNDHGRCNCRPQREGKGNICGRVGVQSSFSPENDIVCGGFSEVFENCMNIPVHFIPIGDFWTNKLGAFQHQIRPQLTFSGAASVANLRQNNQNKEESGNRQRIIERPANESRDSPLPVILGVTCGTIGIAVDLNGRGLIRAIVSAALVVLGNLVPVLLA